MSNSIIGGEFAIDISDYFRSQNQRQSDSDFYYYSSGRAALFQILKDIKKKGVFEISVPSWLCSSITKTIEVANCRWSSYLLNEYYKCDIDSLQSPKAILLINYFGMIDNSDTIDSLRSLYPEIIIIEDNVQSLFSMFVESKSDYSFTSLRKTLPIPDGALVKTKSLLSLMGGEEINSLIIRYLEAS